MGRQHIDLTGQVFQGVRLTELVCQPEKGGLKYAYYKAVCNRCGHPFSNPVNGPLLKSAAKLGTRMRFRCRQPSCDPRALRRVTLKARWRAGESIRTLAREFGVSPQRVHQIVGCGLSDAEIEAGLRRLSHADLLAAVLRTKSPVKRTLLNSAAKVEAKR